MLNVEVNVAGKRILTSGVIILDENENTFSISVEDLSFNFEFLADTSRHAITPFVRVVSETGTVGNIQLVNFFKSDPTTYIMPKAFTVGQVTAGLGLVVQTISGPKGTTRIINYSVRC